jgi:hypothetical protein
MVYSGRAQVGGRIASVGQRLMDSAARSIIRQSLEALNEYLKIQMAESAPPPPISAVVASTIDPAAAEVSGTVKTTGEFKRSSQTIVAVNVAKDVLSDFIPIKYRPWLVAAIILVIVIIVLMTRR